MVSLFNKVTYGVLLCHSDSDEWVKVEHRHLFDPFTRTISESEEALSHTRSHASLPLGRRSLKAIGLPQLAFIVVVLTVRLQAFVGIRRVYWDPPESPRIDPVRGENSGGGGNLFPIRRLAATGAGGAGA